MLTRERVDQIINQARDKSTYGPWSDHLDKVMTPEEIREVKDRWDTLPGHYCFVDALLSFR